jgi:hypothetical protein
MRALFHAFPAKKKKVTTLCVAIEVKVKASRANRFVSQVVTIKKPNSPKRILFSFVNNFEIDRLFHQKHLGEILQFSVNEN